jgi:L-rhamnose mutarotase
MRRETAALRVRPGKEAEFIRRCAELPGSLFAPKDLHGVRNASIWRVEDLAFCYAEVDDAMPAERERMLLERFLDNVRDCCDCLANPFSSPMRLMYEDIGIVREDKSAIRHRVFVTKLKPGCAEEYKRRHDALAASRGGRVNPGPESNFTIWNAGDDYIFGYCELDRSMERPPTQAERQAAVEWETRGLEIMDWLTDDVDWLTGMKHGKIELLFKQG